MMIPCPVVMIPPFITCKHLAWPYLVAASTVTILPILALFFTQRTSIEGITGIKG